MNDKPWRVISEKSRKTLYSDVSFYFAHQWANWTIANGRHNFLEIWLVENGSRELWSRVHKTHPVFCNHNPFTGKPFPDSPSEYWSQMADRRTSYGKKKKASV